MERHARPQTPEEAGTARKDGRPLRRRELGDLPNRTMAAFRSIHARRLLIPVVKVAATYEVDSVAPPENSPFGQASIKELRNDLVEDSHQQDESITFAARDAMLDTTRATRDEAQDIARFCIRAHQRMAKSHCQDAILNATRLRAVQRHNRDPNDARQLERAAEPHRARQARRLRRPSHPRRLGTLRAIRVRGGRHHSTMPKPRRCQSKKRSLSKMRTLCV